MGPSQQFQEDSASASSKNRKVFKTMRLRNNYALNDFDDNYSVSDADQSMISGSIHNHRRPVSGLPFLDASNFAMVSTSHMMREMAGDCLQGASTAADEAGRRDLTQS